MKVLLAAWVVFCAMMPSALIAQSGDLPAVQPQAQTPAPAPENPASAPPTGSTQPGVLPEKRPLHRATRHSRKRRTAHKKKPGPPQTNAGEPSKVIVRNGGSNDKSPQISPAMSKEMQAKQRAATEQLLSATEGNLKRIEGRQLDANQQAMLTQIRTYEKQSKAASASGDIERANTLAQKARLLSEDLARR
jgi:hypothetical protein